MKEKLFKSISIIILSIMILNFSLVVNVYAENISELETPNGLAWKDGSTATATWNAVSKANYYMINVYLYNQNHQLIETTETGTATNELDLQQEIYKLLSEKIIANYLVNYDVTALYIEDSFSIYSNTSEKCTELVINKEGKTKLATPTNVALNDNCYASWSTTDSLSNIWFFGFDWKFECNGNIKYVYGTGTSDAKKGTNVNVKDQIKSAYDKAGFTGETVKVAIRVKSWADYDTDYKNGEPSEYSNYIEYSSTGKKVLATPTNVILNDNYYVSWSTTDSLSNIWFFGFDWKFECNGNIKYVYGTGTSDAKKGTNVNVKDQIKSAYDKAGFTGETVKVAIRVKSWADYDTDYKNGEPSEYSNYIYYNPNGSTVIDTITISPNKPVIAVGKSLYIGKTIEPNNALYSTINWFSTNPNIVSIDNMGKITGIRKGNATITAQINNASQNAEVSVYEITSNINNSSENGQVIDKATDIITAITKDKDTSNTDITNVNDAINEIETGAENGNDFNIDVKYNIKSANEYKNIEDKVKTKYGKDKQIAGGYDVKMELSHTDKQKQEHHIGNITKFDNNITFEVNLLDNMPEIKLGQKRKYSMAKLHNNELELLNINLDDNKISTSSNEFSDFILLYKDINMKGDVSIDSKVNITDVALVNAHVKKTKLLTGEELARADINGDGKINITDVALINSHVKKIKMLDD